MSETPEWKPNPTDDLPMGSLQDQLRKAPPGSKPAAPWFKRGDHVRKRSGSAWQGYVCGEYSTSLIPQGYAVESEFHPGSVQIYPATALEHVPRDQ